MSNPAIDFNEVADGVSAVLSRRAHEAQTARHEADARREAEAHRQAEAARAQQIATIRSEFARLCTLQKNLKAEIDTKREAESTLARELPVLGAQLSALLSQLGRMREQYPFLKG
jgi:chromosome segregation ATPase